MHRFVLLGRFQSDNLEGEFGVYRQMSGGCYYIAVEQVCMSARFRQMKYLSALDLDLEEVPHQLQAPCCSSCTSPLEALIQECTEAAVDVDETELAALYFICGYVALKESIPSDESSPANFPRESEFTSLVSRGKLRHPPEWLFAISQVAYHLFQKAKRSCGNQVRKSKK